MFATISLTNPGLENMANEWNSVKGQSRLTWNEAKQATRAAWDRVERAWRGGCNRRAKIAVHRVEQPQVGTPGGGGRLNWPLEEVRPLERKRAARGAGEPPPCHVLPVRRVHEQLPHVVRARLRSPCGAVERHTTQRATKVGAVPGGVVVRGVEQDEERIERAHGSRLKAHARLALA